jgi:hypothetical protein
VIGRLSSDRLSCRQSNQKEFRLELTALWLLCHLSGTARYFCFTNAPNFSGPNTSSIADANCKLHFPECDPCSFLHANNSILQALFVRSFLLRRPAKPDAPTNSTTKQPISAPTTGTAPTYSRKARQVLPSSCQTTVLVWTVRLVPTTDYKLRPSSRRMECCSSDPLNTYLLPGVWKDVPVSYETMNSFVLFAFI